MMKTCLLCGASARADLPTCPNDGEASWSAPVAAQSPYRAPADDLSPAVDHDEPADNLSPEPPKGGRRRR